MPGYSPIGNGHGYPLMYVRQSPVNMFNSVGVGMPSISQGPGFTFQKRNQRVDWRKLAAIDVDRVARDVDVAALQDNILNVAFCDIKNELDVRSIDNNFLKLFLLAQLTIEYLLHSQEYLQGYINESENKVQEIIQGQDNFKAELDKKNEAYRNLKKEYHKTKKMLGEYQMMIRAGSSGAHRCPFCSKSFVTEEFLRRHIERRHADTGSTTRPVNQPMVVSLPEQEKNQLLEEIQKISTRLQMTEAKLQTEANERNQLVSQHREKDLEQIREAEKEQIRWKEREEQRLKDEMEKYKDMIMQELKDVHAQKDAAETALSDLRRQQGGRKSLIGDLEDVDEGPEKRIQVLKDDFSGQIQALRETYQDEFNKLERKFRGREERVKSEYEEELQKSRAILEQYEAVLNNQRTNSNKGDQEQHEKMQSMAQKLRDLEKIVEEQKQSKESTAALTLSQLDKPPPLPPPRSPQTSVQRLKSPGDQRNPDTDDIISLWVASLNNQNYRVWRSSSPAQSDWKDLFSFCSTSRPSGSFDIPIFVYSAGGSPYWRQYISAHSNPPRSHYKQDFVFFVSNSELLGTFKVNVLDSGSGSVIKSMLSRNDQVDGWKDKGLTFYVMKPKTGQGVTKSVSFISTLEETESGDDVSVSSYTGTEEAKRNLAEVLKRSREDLIKAQEEELDGEEEEFDSEEEGDEEMADDDGNHLAQSSSTSLWGSTLFETGTFRPFKNNPLAIAQYNHSEETLEVCRNEAIESLEHILSNYGVNPDATRMPMRQFQAKMKNHENRVKQLALEKEEFITKRRRVDSDVDNLAQERFSTKKSSRQTSGASSSDLGSSKRKSKFKSAISAIRSATKFSRPSEERISSQPSQTMSSTGSYEELTPSNTPLRGQQTDSDAKRAQVERFQTPSRAKPQTRLSRAEEINETPYGDDDLSGSEEWDSEQISDEDYSPSPTAQLPKVTVSKPVASAQTPVMKTRTPRGEKVRELAASLEASLNSRDSNKKLAGAVDLHRTDQSKAGSTQGGRRPVQSSPLRDDFDDGSDFSLSSLEDGGNQPSAVGRFKDEESDDDAIEAELRGVLSPKSGYQPSRISTAKSPVRALSPKPQTAVSKISFVDDFDDDSDLELQHIT